MRAPSGTSPGKHFLQPSPNRQHSMTFNIIINSCIPLDQSQWGIFDNLLSQGLDPLHQIVHHNFSNRFSQLATSNFLAIINRSESPPYWLLFQSLMFMKLHFNSGTRYILSKLYYPVVSTSSLALSDIINFILLALIKCSCPLSAGLCDIS